MDFLELTDTTQVPLKKFVFFSTLLNAFLTQSEQSPKSEIRSARPSLPPKAVSRHLLVGAPCVLSAWNSKGLDKKAEQTTARIHFRKEFEQ